MDSNNLAYDFYKLLSCYSNAEKLIRDISKKGEMFLFGGAVRSYLENKFAVIPRDFDIVIKTKEDTTIEDCFSAIKHKKNRYGGYKVSTDGLDFDIWQMQYTWAFSQKKVAMRDENLTKSVFLNIDSIVYSFDRDVFYDDIYNETMKTKTLDIVLKDNPYVELNLLRALVFKKMYDMQLSCKLREFFLECYGEGENKFISNLYNLQLLHYGKEHFSRNEIIEEIVKISNEGIFTVQC